MNTHYLPVVIFTVGVGVGWLGRAWIEPHQQVLPDPIEQSYQTPQPAATTGNKGSVQQRSPTSSNDSINASINADTDLISNSSVERPALEPDNLSITDTFSKMLRDRLYDNAINLYQEQEQQNTQAANRMRIRLLKELSVLKETRNSMDFSALTASYLAVYYDDIEVLLLQADFHQSNGNYQEAINTYLLAKTYSYSEVSQQKVIDRFDDFVNKTDNMYTSQRQWGPLIGFYSHIDTSGLITPKYQYQQAIAHLRSGDEFFAVEQLSQLLGDRQVGDAAALVLSDLSIGTETTPVTPAPDWDGADSIALQKSGNQYLVDLSNNLQSNVQLLIDTGASMTAITRDSFDTLNSNGEAVEEETRQFRTAGGVVTGTVYTFPELILGPYLMQNTQIAVIDFDTEREIDGLLGMNILDQFRFQIDQENVRLLLSKKEQQ